MKLIKLPYWVHFLLIFGLIGLIFTGLISPPFALLIVPCSFLLIILLGYYILKLKYRNKIITGLIFLFIALLARYIVIPYYQFQQDYFLYDANLKLCGDEYSPNAPDVLVCVPKFCKVSNHNVDFGIDGRDGQHLKGIITQHEWRIYDGGVVYLQFEPYPHNNRYCFK